MRERLVIIGAGMATGRLLEHLMAEAPEAYDITLFNAEPRGSYNRLMLSPVLSGEQDYEEIITHDDDWYARHGITTRFGEWVTDIDRVAKRVIGTAGAVAYDRLVIATGSTPVIIPLPGHDLAGVIAYRDFEDTEAMIRLADMPAQSPAPRAVVIGGGLLGLEAAAGMAARGIRVTVVHLAEHLMERQLDAAAAGLLQQALEARGIEILCSANSDAILPGADGRVGALRLKDGRELPCDLLVMAVGIRPATGLASACDLAVGRGITVDDQLTTSDPAIFALGECVEHRGTLFGLVAPLYDQAKVLAQILAGRTAAFASKEVSTKLKVTGCDLFSAGDFQCAEDREEIIYSDPAAAIYKRLVIAKNRLIGAVIYGDTQDGGWFFNLIRDGVDISDLRDCLIFGPAFQDGALPDPAHASATSHLSEVA